MLSWLAVLELTPAEHRGVCFGVQKGVPVSASIPSWAGRVVVGLEAGMGLMCMVCVLCRE